MKIKKIKGLITSSGFGEDSIIYTPVSTKVVQEKRKTVRDNAER